MKLRKRLRLLAAPPDTLRERVYISCRDFIINCRDRGIRVACARVKHGIRSLLPGAKRLEQERNIAYAQWIRLNEPGVEELERQCREAREFGTLPLVSIITPVFNPPVSVLKQTVESVLQQTYSNWELCLVNGGTKDPAVRRLLDGYARGDRRIRVRHLDENLGISGNSNEALEMSQGDYVSILDHDDLLAPNLLFEVVRVLNENPDADIVYFDEDKISADGSRRREPWFKPHHVSRTLALSTNFLMHSVVRKSLLEEVGRFDPDMDGAQDWDLALRILEATSRLYHVPKVLYHWRQIPGSAASDANAKPWAYEAQKRCLEAHLERTGSMGARVEFASVAQCRIVWPPTRSTVSIVIPTRDNVERLRACLESIFDKTTYRDYEIVIVDNASTEPESLAYYEELQRHPRVCIIHYNEPFNCSRACNLGARHARGDCLALLNDDTEVLEPGWLEEMVGLASRPSVGIVGAKLVRPDDTIRHAGIIVGLEGHGGYIYDGGLENTYGIYGSTEWYRDYMAVSGACLLIRREVYEALGGMDEGYRAAYGDIDLCLRARQAGYFVTYSPYARILHHERSTRGLSVPASDVLRASMRMIRQIREGDPYFNPNLSYHHRIPALARPGEETREHRIIRILQDFGMAGPLAGPPSGDDFECESRRGSRST